MKPTCNVCGLDFDRNWKNQLTCLACMGELFAYAELGEYVERLLGVANQILLRVTDNGDRKLLRKLISEYEDRFEQRVAKVRQQYTISSPKELDVPK